MTKLELPDKPINLSAYYDMIQKMQSKYMSLRISNSFCKLPEKLSDP